LPDTVPMGRSEMMSRIGPRDTAPEMAVRRGLHRLGFRFRLHRGDLPGRPDVVLPRHRAVIFVHGCFWHGHEACPYFRLPKTNTGFWEAKIGRNAARDAEAVARLVDGGWRVLTVWECATRRRAGGDVPERIAAWLRGTQRVGELRAPAGTPMQGRMA
jgi:DNA mismatch endonuclease, patch repair protein